MFPLPSQAARRAILGIHTRRWDPPPPAPLLAELAQRCVGFCGADLKARRKHAPRRQQGTCMHRPSRVTGCVQLADAAARSECLQLTRRAAGKLVGCAACGRCSIRTAAHTAAAVLADSRRRSAGADCACTRRVRRLRHALLVSGPEPAAAPAQALCSEASLRALRRAYPQIYASDAPLALDPGAVSVGRRDFLAALAAITPASHRSATAHARCRPRPLSYPTLPCQPPPALGDGSEGWFRRVCLRSQGARGSHQLGPPCAHAVRAGQRRGARQVRPPRLSAPPARARRRLPALVTPALEPELQIVLAHLAAAFPPVAACLAASGDGAAACASPAPGGAGVHLGASGDADSDAEGDGAPWAARARVSSAPARSAEAGAPTPTAGGRLCS